jgi:signal transduction histidine kinase
VSIAEVSHLTGAYGQTMSAATTRLSCALDAYTALPNGLLAKFLECAPLPVFVARGSDHFVYLNAQARSLWAARDAGSLGPSSAAEATSELLDSVREASNGPSAGPRKPIIRLPNGEEYGIETLEFGSAPDAAWTLAILLPPHRDSSEDQLFRHKVSRLKAIVHEMRNTLNAAKEAVAFVNEGTLGGLNADQRRFLQSATEDLEHLVRAMADLTSLWVTSASVFRISSGPVQVARILEKSTLYAKPIADKVNISLQIEADDPLPMLVGDHELLFKAVRNVLINALQHTPSGGTIWIRAYGLEATNAHAPDGSVVIEVQDSGAGIRPEERDHIFQPSRHGSAGNASAGGLHKGGMGMGLAIASDIAHIHGGSLHFRDDPTPGSCFVFKFPLSSNHAHQWMVRATQQAVDDVRSLRVPLTAVLLQLHCSTCDSGGQLLSSAQQLAVENLRPSDTVLAIDNQLLLLMRGGTRATGYAVIDRIMHSLIQIPKTAANLPADYSLSFGVAAYPRDGRDAESILERAERERHAFPDATQARDEI